MKKIIYSKIAVIIAIATIVTACSSDFLEQANPNETSTDSFWQTANDLSLGIVSVYNALKSQDIFLLREESYRSDLTYPGFGKPNTSDVYYLQIFNNSASAPNLKWGALYKGIFRANQVIGAYERIAPTLTKTSDITNAKIYYAEAKALRGLFYFYLYNSFRDINDNTKCCPLIETVPLSSEEFHNTLSTAAAIKEFYLKDLEYAKTNLKGVIWTDKFKGRMTEGAVTAILGQSYLYEGNYPKAAEYLKDVIDNYGYALAADIGSNFTTKNEFNSESILEIDYSVAFKAGISPNDGQQVSNSLGSQMSPGNVGGFRVVLPSQWLTMAYKKEKPDMSDPRNTALSSDGTTKARKYSLRTSQSLALADDEFTPYYLKPNAAEGTLFNGQEPAYFRKYTNWDIVDNEKNVTTSFYRSGINFRVIRLADVYLMYAEALIKGGTDNSKLTEALLYVNKVRNRSAVELLGIKSTDTAYPTNDHNEITYTAQTLMDHLMYIERPLELSIEGNAIRTIDMRRWGIAKARFQELATRKYYVLDHVITKSLVTGLKITRFGALLYDYNDPVPAVVPSYFIKDDIRFNEFGQTATNFDPNRQSYWDIPSSELTSNNALSN